MEPRLKPKVSLGDICPPMRFYDDGVVGDYGGRELEEVRIQEKADGASFGDVKPLGAKQRAVVGSPNLE